MPSKCCFTRTDRDLAIPEDPTAEHSAAPSLHKCIVNHRRRILSLHSLGQLYPRAGTLGQPGTAGNLGQGGSGGASTANPFQAAPGTGVIG
jgi:hypothetical protein